MYQQRAVRPRATIIGAIVLVFGLLLSWHLSTGPARAAFEANAGRLEIMDKSGRPAAVCPLKHTSVTADISGFVARVNVRQEFHNPSTTPVEAVYTFPLPHDAAVDEMTMRIGDRVIRGQIRRKEEARQVYEAAKSSGKAAALLDQERPNIFTQSVANILPGSDVTIDISYVNLLKYDDGSYEFSFPMVVGPRFVPAGGYTVPGKRGDPGPAPSAPGDAGTIPPGGAGTVPIVTDAEKITPPITAPGARSGHDISLTVNLDSGVPLRDVKSVLHPVTIISRGPTAATIQLQDQNSIPNKDFILRYTVAGHQIQAGLLAHAVEGEGCYFTLILQPPMAPPQSQVSEKEMVFVIDQTGSQGGWPIEKAKETMKYCIQHLNAGDTFQLIGFNTEVYPCFHQPVPATKTNIAKALAFLSPLEGDGGTDILKSVDYALNIPDDPARLRIVCYMTDGYVGNDIQIIDYIQKHRGRARMFPFGVGSAVNRFLIDGMAREGRGAADYVTLDEDGKVAAEKFYKRIATPVLLDPQVEWNGLPVEEVYPRQIPDVFTYGPIILKGRYTHAAEGNITVHGLLRGHAWTQNLHVSLPARETDNSAIPTLWAREKIEALQSRDWMGAQTGHPNPNSKEELVQVALKYRLMSQYTSFVAVEEKVTNPGGQQQTADVPVEMPEGVSHQGIFGRRAPAAPARAAVMTPPVHTNTSYTGGGGGDPYISVNAPRDTLQVVAVFPTGDAKNLLYNGRLGVWEGRFDIPFGAPAGDYCVTVIIVHRDGARTLYVLTYHNLLSSAATANATTLHAKTGEPVRVTITGAGIRRAVAVAPWGERATLESIDNNWQTQLTVPSSWQPGKSLITLVLLDGAHNRTEISIDLDVVKG